MNADLSSYDDIVALAQGWRAKLLQLKADNPPEEFTWYGYDILSNVWHIDNLLGRDSRDLLARVGRDPIADIGAADGDLAFFLESLGFEVDIIDWPATNWNGLRGARRLKDLLESKAGVHEVDLDSQFRLPRERYGLIYLLGILYHLKNPYYILESLARVSRYCLLSTRVARQTVDGAVRLDKAPLAYLLAPDECNNDATNFWIFSTPGLLRLADRCGWSVVEQMSVGDTRHSDPASSNHDERAFLLLESRHFSM